MLFSNKKGVLLDMFCMWLVRNEIANLLSIPCRERDGYRVTYDTSTYWLINCPNGLTLKFKKDVGVCEGFLYIKHHESCDVRGQECNWSKYEK